jgi:UDP-glucose:(heptosyl)LPS alpha-1,3-glucosyltransferase
MKMKIAIINERAMTALGGAERSAAELTEALQQAGVDVHLIAATGEREISAKNVHILFGDKRTKRVGFCSYKKAIIEHLEKNHYDIIHSFLPFDFADVYQPRGGTYPEAIIRNAASYRNGFIEYYKRITAFANVRRTILWRAERKLCRPEDGPVIAALSNYAAEQFKKHYKTSGRRIVVIPNGVKTDRKIDTVESVQIRAKIIGEFGVKKADKAVLFLFVANNFRLKGLSVLLDAIHLAIHKKTSDPFYLMVAGRDNSRKYMARAKRLGIERRVRFLNYVRDIQKIIAISDAAVLPTFYDPSSRFILEALVAGKPVITTRYNGASELLTDYRHGRIIDEPENIEALAEAIVYFTNKDNIVNASEAIAADNLIEKISINSAVRQLIRLYETILERKKR